MKRQFHVSRLLFLAWALLPLRSVACDCSYPGAPCRAFANTPTVLAGRVLKISKIRLKSPSGDDFEDRLVFFDAEQSYRGWEAKTAEVVTGMGGDAPVLPKSFLPDEQTVKLERNSCAELRFLATSRPHGARGEGRWHQTFQGRLANVEVDRTLYERRKDEDCFIAVRITNMADRPVGVDFRKFWNVIYPNSWGFSETSAPGLVDEERIVREPISEADKKRLILDYSDQRLTTIMPHRSLTYFRGFTIGRNVRREIDSAANRYLIVGLDGALEMTDGQTTEEMIFSSNDELVGNTRWVAIRLPAHWQLVSQDSFLVEERP